jgi:ABC-type branched-subunit amino acid transport system substrate-binding protein
MTRTIGGRRRVHQRRTAVLSLLVAVSLVGGACGSRLTGDALKTAEGSASANGTATASNSGGTNGAAAQNTSNGGGPATPGAATASGSGTGGGGASSGGGGAGGSGGATTASCNSSNNGGATDVGVTATSITVGNIASITGVAPGLTQSAQQAMQAVAAYINSQGGICGRTVKVDSYDDGNTSSGNYAAAQSACSKDFAMVANASGFDDGSASAVSKCGIPDIAAEVSTHEAGNVPQIFGASPGNAHYWSTGPAVYLAKTYPNAVKNAAMVYLSVPATQEQATAEIATYQKAGFNYTYTVGVSATEPNYAPYVQNMESKGVQYVTEYSDDNSAARLAQAMQQANFAPQVVDWFAEMYTPAFLKEAGGTANGNLVLMATAPYEDASSNPGMQLFLSWMNRVAPGFTHDIFAEFAWSAGLAFFQAAKAVGAHLTRTALLQAVGQIHQWDGGGVQFPEDLAGHVPSNCFSYFKINSSGTGYTRVYPSAPNSTDCTSGSLNHY